MFGFMSIGLMGLALEDPQFKCGQCERLSEILPIQIPAFFSLQESAAIHECPYCHLRSAKSQIYDLRHPMVTSADPSPS